MTSSSNFLSPLGFQFFCDAIPDTNFMVQRAVIPGVTQGQVTTPNPYVRLVHTGNLHYSGDFQIDFKISEDLSSYLAIYNWIVSNTRPDEPGQYKNTKGTCTVMVLSSSKKLISKVEFIDCLPMSLTPIDFDSTLTDLQYITATATFSFNRMYFK